MDGRVEAEGPPVEGRLDAPVDGRVDADAPVDGRLADPVPYLLLALLLATVLDVFLLLL